MDNRLLISVSDCNFSLYHHCVNVAAGLIKSPVLYVEYFPRLKGVLGTEIGQTV
jgi:hypothetical protein